MPDDIFKELVSYTSAHFKTEPTNVSLVLKSAKWAINTASKESDGKWNHIVGRIHETIKETGEAIFAARLGEALDNVTIVKSIEVAGIDEAVRVAKELADMKGWNAVDWKSLFESLEEDV